MDISYNQDEIDRRRQAIVSQLQSQLKVLSDLHRHITLLHSRESRSPYTISRAQLDWAILVSTKLSLLRTLTDFWEQPSWSIPANRVNESYHQMDEFQEKFENEMSVIQEDVQNREAFLWRMR